MVTIKELVVPSSRTAGTLISLLMGMHIGTDFWKLLLKLSTYTLWPSINTAGLTPDDKECLYPPKDLCKNIIVKNMKQPKWLSAWNLLTVCGIYIHKVEYYIAIKKNKVPHAASLAPTWFLAVVIPSSAGHSGPIARDMVANEAATEGEEDCRIHCLGESGCGFPERCLFIGP